GRQIKMKFILILALCSAALVIPGATKHATHESEESAELEVKGRPACFNGGDLSYGKCICKPGYLGMYCEHFTKRACGGANGACPSYWNSVCLYSDFMCHFDRNIDRVCHGYCVPLNKIAWGVDY
ncbi:hypothetical protein PFISCL1PPCAC_17883, partial [Pristionchus fissidentatus]